MALAAVEAADVMATSAESGYSWQIDCGRERPAVTSITVRHGGYELTSQYPGALTMREMDVAAEAMITRINQANEEQ